MSTALYRRYRPETFADVIGQDHVTGPLTAALDNQRVTHAYLFSGPRGCGKTTSARIFARCLNCAEGPTSTPCGTCPSCVDLARGGGGSIDVVEMDAASHGGVDDARELRDRAIFGTARDRYKIFVIDEAHMVTTQGFNALLKLVEEPPAHVKFVFATTEPEKVIGTIRSRTHHYPFRLVPPEQLTAYLESLGNAEGVQIDSGVLPLVVRAGGGSVRDSLSVLDQLIAGMDQNAIGYERAVALLGFTHATLLDDTVEALAARDGASLFRVVDRVIDSGHAPRRFVEDLLERLRDLIVVRAAGDQAASVLRAVPADQLERMRTQTTHLGPDTLSRDADLVNEALTEMTGATSPRLQLELLCARLLLPGADDAAVGYGARLERLESAVEHGTLTPAPPQPPSAPVARPETRPHTPAASTTRTDPGPAPAAAPTSAPGAAGSAAQQSQPGPQALEDGGASAAAGAAEAAASSHTGEPARASADIPQEGMSEAEPVDPPQPEPSAVSAPQPGAEDAGALTADHVRRRWPEVLATLTSVKRTTWALISEHAQVVALDAATLQLGFSTAGLASAFSKGGHSEHVQRAVAETLGLQVRVEPIVAEGSASAPARTTPEAAGARQAGATSWEPAPPSSPAEENPQRQQAPTAVSAEPDQPAQTPPEDPVVTAQPSETQAEASTAVESDAPAANSAPAVSSDRQSGPTAESGGSAAPPPWDSEGPSPAGGEGAKAGEVAPSDVEPNDVAPSERAPSSQNTPEDEDIGDAPQGEPVDETVSEEPDTDEDDPVPDWPSTNWAGQIDAPAPVAAEPDRPPEPQPPAEPQPPPEPQEQARSNWSAPVSPREQAMAAAREARTTELSHRSPSAPSPQDEGGPNDYEPPDPNDPTIENTGLVGAPLVARLLGGTVIDEILETPEGGDR